MINTKQIYFILLLIFFVYMVSTVLLSVRYKFLEHQYSKLQSRILEEREQMQQLKAEWLYLNSPSNMENVRVNGYIYLNSFHGSTKSIEGIPKFEQEVINEKVH